MCWALYSGSASAPGNGSAVAKGHPDWPMRGDTTVTAEKNELNRSRGVSANAMHTHE